MSGSTDPLLGAQPINEQACGTCDCGGCRGLAVCPHCDEAEYDEASGFCEACGYEGFD